MVFHWSLRDNKSHQVSRTFLSILAVLNNVVVWMVSTYPPTSKSSSPFNNFLVTVPNAPITIDIIVTFMFHSFFQFPSKVELLILLFTFFRFILWSAGTPKSTILQILFFCCWLLLSLVFWPRLGDPSVCPSPIGVYVSSSRTGAVLCICHFFMWSNFNFLHISQWVTLPTQSCLVLYSFCANLLHSLIDWWFHLCHRIAYICYFVASYLFLLWYDWFLRRYFVLLLLLLLFILLRSQKTVHNISQILSQEIWI